jgi:thiamine-phosphate pyrophosphorylase
MMVGADGVHVGQDDLPPEKIRELVGQNMIIGLSTHSPEQAQKAAALGVVDYIGVGPIYATKTKKDVCQPVGLSYLDYVVKNIDLPFVAIGGIKEHNIKQVRQSGAKIICLVTDIVAAADIGAKVDAVRRAMN